ncbi:MAG: nitrile hydratase accessory protein [Beijerinckiaceae bacterium]|nr:nitrile hydratase accessory protein [Beijerinckiaceae bacterium]
MPGNPILSAPDAASLFRRDAPPFRAPWEAQAFALTVALHDKGLLTWAEWAEALGAEIKAAQARDPASCDDGSDYYLRWLAATETLIARKGIASEAALAARKAAWERATEATPHGQEIVLANDPLGGAG